MDFFTLLVAWGAAFQVLSGRAESTPGGGQLRHLLRQGDDIEFQCSLTSQCPGCHHYGNLEMYYRSFGGHKELLYDTRFDGRLMLLKSQNFVLVTLSNAQFTDAGAFSCESYQGSETHNIIVIGKDVQFSANGNRDVCITNEETCRANCSFDMSPHPWENEFSKIEVKGAIGSEDASQIGSKTTKEFQLPLGGLGLFKCTVTLVDNFTLESNLLHVIASEATPEDETYVGIRGESVVLHCLSPHSSNSGWMWFQENLFQDKKLSFPVVECSMIGSERCDNSSSTFDHITTNSYSLLRFMAIERRSSLTYTCVDDTFAVYKSFNVIVVDRAPSKMEVNGTLMERNGTYEIVKGEMVVISCFIFSPYEENIDDDHHPRLVVENADFLNVTRVEDQLVYHYEATINESKSYTCSLEIDSGFVLLHDVGNYTIHFDVFYCPEHLTIFSAAKNGSIESGSVLSCQTSAVPAVQVAWSANNRTLRFDGRPNYADARAYDDNTYSCQTRSQWHRILGLCPSLEASLELDRVVARQYEEIPRAVRLGRSLSIECTGYYIRNKNWKWIRNWNPKEVQEPLVDCKMAVKARCTNTSSWDRIRDYSTPSLTRITFPSTDFKDSGTYSCMDALRTVFKTFKVDVFACPSKLILSKKTTESGEVELTCTVSANPPVEVTWTAGNDNSSSLADGMNTARVTISTNGSYRCYVLTTVHPFLGRCGGLSLIEYVEEL